MQNADTAFVGADPSGVISKSLDAGLEIEKSRLAVDFNPEVVHEFGRLLASKMHLDAGTGRRGFSDPDYVVPLRNLYLSERAQQSAGSLDEILRYWSDIAMEFIEFDPALSADAKKRLVHLCAQLHQYLSDELRNHEEPGFHGWWN